MEDTMHEVFLYNTPCKNKCGKNEKSSIAVFTWFDDGFEVRARHSHDVDLCDL